jgi:phage repressor protein C with HTH and peptisase S24 domain
MGIGNRIKAARKQCLLTQTELAQAVGVSPQSVQQWESGDSEPKRGRMPAIAKVLNITVEQLEFDPPIAMSDEVYRRQYPEAPSSYEEVPIINGDLDGSDERVEIPAYHVQASAGSGSSCYTEKPNGVIGFRRGWIKKKGLQGDKLVAIQVDGDSMAPYIGHEDTVLVDTRRSTIRSGDIYVFRVDSDLRCKRLFKNIDGSVLVHSDNDADPRYKDETLSPTDLEHVHIIGSVVWRGGTA